MRTKADTAVFIVTGTTLLTFFIASRIGTIWVLYPNVLIATVLFVYCIWQTDEDAALLSRSSIFGIATTLTYVPIDWLFSRKVHLIFYLRSDFLAGQTTPIGLILNWVVFATLSAYCYQRLATIFRTRFVSESGSPRIGFIGTAMLAAGITSIVAVIGSTLIYEFGASYLWTWNATQVDLIPHIASVPVFIPISFLLTFLLCPYFFGVDGSFLREQHVGVAGIRCGIFMGALQFFGFLLFYVWK
ncbi:MAG: hypothetical protein OXU27_13935 [Candidatus Poribacteria bacterium]|nr:hypothetical protein [Candidatus Poribacteria bacterium]MDD9975108.1 hypothetical protein [Candidatus Poribacteria bacterium]